MILVLVWRRCNTDHVVHVLPVVEGDELEGGEHGPEEVVEAGEPVVGVPPDPPEAGVPVRTGSEYEILWDLNLEILFFD